MAIMFTSPSENAVSLINHISSMSNTLNIMTKDLCNTNDTLEKIDIISDAMKEVEPTLMCSIEELKFFTRYLLSLNKSLQVKRFDMINQIDKRRNTEIQMNTMGEMYSEDELIKDIQFNFNGETPSGVYQINMKQMEDVKDYSVLALVSKFEKEETLLEDLYTITEAEAKNFTEIIMKAKSDITSAKNSCEDSEFISKVCNGDMNDDAVKTDLNAFFACATQSSLHINHINGKLIKLFQIYQELIHNYQIYDKAITSYTSFALECFFNDASKYEIL